MRFVRSRCFSQNAFRDGCRLFAPYKRALQLNLKSRSMTFDMLRRTLLQQLDIRRLFSTELNKCQYK